MSRPTKQPLYICARKTGDFYYSDTDPETLYLSRAGLRRIGWVDKLIDALMPQPCRLAENPHNPQGRPMALYSVARVMDKEQRTSSSEIPEPPKPRKPRTTQPERPRLAPLQLGLPLDVPMQAQPVGDLARDFER